MKILGKTVDSTNLQAMKDILPFVIEMCPELTEEDKEKIAQATLDYFIKVVRIVDRAQPKPPEKKPTKSRKRFKAPTIEDNE
jgi:hypothetical protein